MQDYLIHYGVKGMKWGVRHDPVPSGRKRNRSGTDKTSKKFNSSKAKKVAKYVGIGLAVAAAAGVVTIGGKAGFDSGVMGYKHYFNKNSKEFSKIPLSELGSKDVIVQKGKDTIQRITQDPVEKESLKDVIYSNFKENDKRMYESYFNNVGHTSNKNPKQIQTRDLVRDITSPSERKRVMYFMQMVNTDSSFVKALESDVNTIYKEKGIKKTFSIDTKNSRKYYKDFFQQFGRAQSKSRKMYIDKLKERGYNAVIDDNDAGWHAESPIVLFDAHKDTIITGQRAKKKSDILNGILKANTPIIHEDAGYGKEVLYSRRI